MSIFEKLKDLDIRKLPASELECNILQTTTDDNKDQQDKLCTTLTVATPVLLQLLFLKRADLPSSSSLRDDSKKFYEVQVTDGTTKYLCVYIDEEMDSPPLKKERQQQSGRKEPNMKLSLKCAPGSKLSVQGRIQVWGGVLYLNPSNCAFIGGTVDKLVKNWEEQRAKQTTKLIL